MEKSLKDIKENFLPEISKKSAHFPGLLVINMTFGFVIIFHFILFLMIFIHMIYWQVSEVTPAVNILVPFAVIYIFQKLTMNIFGKQLLVLKPKSECARTCDDTYPCLIYLYFFYGRIKKKRFELI